MHTARRLRHIHDSYWKSAPFCSYRATDDSSPDLSFRGTDSCGNWHWAFAVEFCCNTRSSTFPGPNGNTRHAIPWNPCAEFREQTTETGASKAYPISYSKWVAFVFQDRGQE